MSDTPTHTANTAPANPWNLPPLDHELSPHTGWTRAHWEAAADGLLTAAWRWAGPEGALLNFPGRASMSGERSDGLEGYARTFLAAAFRVAGAGGEDPHGWLDRYAEGLAAGTRAPGREDDVSWPLIGDFLVQGQPMVESASVALGLRLTAPWLWDRLDEGVQDRAEAWLRGSMRHSPAPNNWYLFPFTVAAFLESVGRGDAETARAMERGLSLLDGWYRGDGWYADGDGRGFDHYNGWALHLYPMLHAHLAGDADLLGHYGPRLRTHLESFSLLFDGNGAPVHFGRSLTYRFAAGSAVGLGALTGHTPLSPGTSRRLISGAARYFLDRGAAGENGLLSLGWHGPHPSSLQVYSGPGSPYWASKAFLCLLTPESDPLWTAREEPAPAETADHTVALRGPGLLIHTTAEDGLVRLHNHGSNFLFPAFPERAEEEAPTYSRLAYSTRTGPTASDPVADNHFALELPWAPGEFSVRRAAHPLGSGTARDGSWAWAASWHTPVFPAHVEVPPELRVKSLTLVRGRYELRVHRVLGAPEGARVRETGWATAPDEPLTSALFPLLNWQTPEPEPQEAPAGTAYTPTASVPALTAPAGPLFATLATLTTEPPAPKGARILSTGADSLDMEWPDDGTTFHVRLTPAAVFQD
ncbi:DUF2264 domain-containing protein [Streptomyces sp. ODS28]|uniref:DUF2264 domain-containing protein n=1 Tax=Streptomyces sp. ODS28 TaxID=3136688 RepID=UPI0031EED3A3